MAEPPTIDGRDREAVADHLREIAPAYTDEWDPESGDAAAAVLECFAGMAGDVVERLDRLPQKHRVGFLDAMGFTRDPPRPASLPVAVEVADGAAEPVHVPAGTAAVAEDADGEQRHFTVDRGFDATPATLRRVYSVDPAADAVVDHTAALVGGEGDDGSADGGGGAAGESDAATTLFAPRPPATEDEQRHALYVGDAAALDLGADPTLQVSVRTDASPVTLTDDLAWEYHGERESTEGERWRPVAGVELSDVVGSRVVHVDDLLDVLAGEGRRSLAERWRRGDYRGVVVAVDEFLASLGLETDGSLRQVSVDSQRRGATTGLDPDAPLTDERLRAHLLARSRQVVAEAPEDPVVRGLELDLPADATITGTEVDGRESTWIRCRVPDGDADPPFDLVVGAHADAADGAGAADASSGAGAADASSGAGASVDDSPDGDDGGWSGDGAPIRLHSLAGSLEPDRLLANDVPMPAGDERDPVIRPFGDWPRQGDAFYVACRDALTKGGVRATLHFRDDRSEAADDEFVGTYTVQPLEPEEPASVDEADLAWIDAARDDPALEAAQRFGQEPGDGAVEEDALSIDPDALDRLVRYGRGGFDYDVQLPPGATLPEFEDPDSGDQGPDEPELSWEYHDGDGWTALPEVRDRTDALRSDGPVTFTVPEDLEPATVAGHEEHWLRVRLVGGDYGRLGVERQEDESGEESWVTKRSFEAAPAFGECDVGYDDEGRPPDHVLAENNRAFGPDHVAAGRERFRPFRPAPTDGQTLYLGFDGPLSGGPVPLLVEPADRQYPTDFAPGVRWEYSAGPDGETWRRAETGDGSEGLTGRGVVRLGFDEPTTRASLLGHDLHWIRARVTRDRFEPPPDGAADGEGDAGAGDGRADGAGGDDDRADGVDAGAGRRDGAGAGADHGDGAGRADDGGASERGGTSDGGAARADCLPDPCGVAVRTGPPAGAAPRLPALRSLVPNAAWARDVRRLEREVLGSSDGSAEQAFVVERPPAIDPEVWVEESAVLTDDRRTALRERAPERVELEGDADDPDAVWVRWERQPDLLSSGPGDRHYVVEPVTGRIAFGDDERGAIPPRGTENVRATYDTGGGSGGNVAANAVAGLDRSRATVESVTNPLPADGGTDAEPTRSVARRGPETLRDRGRAVTAADVERVARTTTRSLARVECRPGMDPRGEHAPGWVTLLVVPDGPGPRPAPSATLRRRIEERVAERAPLGLVGADRLEVRGPSYVPVSVAATVATTDSATRTATEEAVRRALDAFLDPLSGGPDGEGWAFGDLPCASETYARLEAVDGVDHVASLVLRVRGRDGTHEVEGGDARPTVDADALVAAGEHEVVATSPGDGRGTGGR